MTEHSIKLYASTRAGAPSPELVCRENHSVLQELIAARLMDTVPRARARPSIGRMRARLHRRRGRRCVRVQAFSRRPHAYYAAGSRTSSSGWPRTSPSELSHQRLAEAARRAAVDRERTASIESLGGAAADDLGRPRHSRHRTPAGLRDRAEGAAARSPDADVSRPGCRLLDRGGLLG